MVFDWFRRRLDPKQPPQPPEEAPAESAAAPATNQPPQPAAPPPAISPPPRGGDDSLPAQEVPPEVPPAAPAVDQDALAWARQAYARLKAEQEAALGPAADATIAAEPTPPAPAPAPAPAPPHTRSPQPPPLHLPLHRPRRSPSLNSSQNRTSSPRQKRLSHPDSGLPNLELLRHSRQRRLPHSRHLLPRRPRFPKPWWGRRCWSRPRPAARSASGS